MNIVEVAPHTFQFKPVPCNECDYRFACWTIRGDSCALKGFRVFRTYDERNHHPALILDVCRTGMIYEHYLLARTIGYDLWERCNAKGK